ncbi:hypothetical protein HW746_001273 [Campylobacter jejuni]|nr:hypothetical protein [Campylobacter jejuni]
MNRLGISARLYFSFALIIFIMLFIAVFSIVKVNFLDKTLTTAVGGKIKFPFGKIKLP